MAKKKENEKPVEEKIEQAAETEIKEAAEANGETEEKTEETEVIQNAKLQKKREAREAKAARKAKNKVVEEQKRPSNKILAIMIFGVLILMFLFVGGYNMSQKEASIQSYIKNNGGKDTYSNLYLDSETTLSVTAKKNNMKVTVKVTTDDAKAAKKTYKGDSSKEYIEYIAAYYLSTIKPETRALFAKANIVVKINGKELYTDTVRYRKSDKIVEDYTNKQNNQHV